MVAKQLLRFVRSKYPLFDAVWSFLLKTTAINGYKTIIARIFFKG